MCDWESTMDDDLATPRETNNSRATWSSGGYVSPEYHAPERSGCFRPGLRLDGEKQATIRLTNPANRVAFFVRAEVTHGADGNEILPITYDDNYITVFPHKSGRSWRDLLPCLGIRAWRPWARPASGRL